MKWITTTKQRFSDGYKKLKLYLTIKTGYTSRTAFRNKVIFVKYSYWRAINDYQTNRTRRKTGRKLEDVMGYICTSLLSSTRINIKLGPLFERFFPLVNYRRIIKNIEEKLIHGILHDPEMREHFITGTHLLIYSLLCDISDGIQDKPLSKGDSKEKDLLTKIKLTLENKGE